MTDKPINFRIWSENGAKTDPGDDKYDKGWVVEIPTLQNMNFIQNQISEFLQHINEQGIPSWDNATTYPIGAIAKANDKLTYKALVENTGVAPEGSADWELWGSASGDFTLRAFANVSYSVGPTGDYTTLNKALEALSRYHSEYRKNAVTCTLTLQSGYILAEEVHVSNVNLSWITITSAQGSTPHVIDSSAIVTSITDFGDTAFLAVANGGVSPRIDFYTKYDAPLSGDLKHGFMVLAGGTLLGKDFGCDDAGGDGLSVHFGGVVSATGSIKFDGARRFGIYCSNGSCINTIGDADASYSDFVGIKSDRGAVVAITGNITATNCVNHGVLAVEGGKVTCENMYVRGVVTTGSSDVAIGAGGQLGGFILVSESLNASECGTGVASFASSIQCKNLNADGCVTNGAYADGAGGDIFVSVNMTVNNSLGNGAYAELGATISAEGSIDASTAAADGVKVTEGASIVTGTLVVSDAGNHGVEADSGGSVHARSISANNCGTNGVFSNASGTAVSSIGDISATGCDTGIGAQYGADVSANGTMTTTDCVSFGIHAGGGQISGTHMNARVGATDAIKDCACHNGGMIKRVTFVGGQNVTGGIFNSDGYINN